MSKCHFPSDFHTVVLDAPEFQQIQLRLIETNQRLPDPSMLSLSCLEAAQPSTQLLRDNDFEEDSLGQWLQEGETSQAKTKRKTGCTCKKTNCIKMYCECFSVGKQCTSECACFGCQNHGQNEGLLEKVKQRSMANRHQGKGCNCKKTNCQKKYCECFNAGLPCTENCNCNNCHNIHGERG